MRATAPSNGITSPPPPALRMRDLHRVAAFLVVVQRHKAVKNLIAPGTVSKVLLVYETVPGGMVAITDSTAEL